MGIHTPTFVKDMKEINGVVRDRARMGGRTGEGDNEKGTNAFIFADQVLPLLQSAFSLGPPHRSLPSRSPSHLAPSHYHRDTHSPVLAPERKTER